LLVAHRALKCPLFFPEIPCKLHPAPGLTLKLKPGQHGIQKTDPLPPERWLCGTVCDPGAPGLCRCMAYPPFFPCLIQLCSARAGFPGNPPFLSAAVSHLHKIPDLGYAWGSRLKTTAYLLRPWVAVRIPDLVELKAGCSSHQLTLWMPD
jgi:hypothetical protein